MEVVSRSVFPVAGRVWQPRPGSFVFTFACKVTLSLGPGKLELAKDQEPVNEDDRPWSDAVTSLYAACDLVPSKAGPDVVLIGNAFAPDGVPAQKVVARLSVGEVDKSIEVWADRTRHADGSVAEGQPFTAVPLLYERAAGGPDNPVGMSADRDAYGNVPLPNLTPPGTRVDAPIRPIGFGPIAAHWPARRVRLGRHADTFSTNRWYDKPLPPDLDMAYFNVAPPDQQPLVLRGDETLVLENLHPEHPKLSMTLPGLRLMGKVNGRGGEKQLEMSCDTLWIDTSRRLCCLTYRGQVTLSSPTEAGWVIVSSGRHVTMIDSEESGRHRAVDVPFSSSQSPPPSPPKRPQAATVPIFSSPSEQRPVDSAIPFRPPSGLDAPASIPKPPPSFPRRDTPTEPPPSPPTAVTIPNDKRRSEPVIPFRRDVPPPPPPAPSSPGGLPPPWASQVIPASVPVPPPIKPPAAPVFSAPPLTPPPADSPWAVASAVAGAGTIAAVTAAGVAEAQSTPTTEPSRPLVIPMTRQAPKEPGDVLDLLFYDADSLPRIRRVAAWKKILEALEDRPLEAEEDDPAAAKEPEQIEDRREVLELMVRAPPSDAAAIDDAVARAARDDGRYLPPIVMVSGELSTPFDEVETLKTMITIVTPLAGNDENLRASLEIAKDLVKLPGISSSPQVVEGVTGRLRESFAQSKRAMQPAALDAQVERALVEQRVYQHRKVLGGRRHRALFHFLPSGSDSKALVTYLPETVESKLPLFARFKARLIVRVHLPLDPYEQGHALEALALARLCPSPIRRDPK